MGTEDLDQSSRLNVGSKTVLSLFGELKHPRIVDSRNRAVLCVLNDASPSSRTRRPASPTPAVVGDGRGIAARPRACPSATEFYGSSQEELVFVLVACCLLLDACFSSQSCKFVRPLVLTRGRVACARACNASLAKSANCSTICSPRPADRPSLRDSATRAEPPRRIGSRTHMCTRRG
jgi:hypothetical protein